jgi:hypothetical protein
MKLTEIQKNIAISLLSFGLFGICLLIAILIEPNTLEKLFSAKSIEEIESDKSILDKAGYYYDLTAYAAMTLKDKCIAFYPMFPWIVRNLFRPHTFEQGIIGLKIISFICFTVGIPVFFSLCRNIDIKHNTAFLLTLMYTISPMAIFRVIGYTEGLFSLLSLILIWLITNTKLNKIIIYIFLFCTVFIMSLTRPVAIQITFSVLASLITIGLIEKLKNRLNWYDTFQIMKAKYSHFIYQSLIIIIAVIIGYSIYGFICAELRGDFFAPFNDQKLWGKALGFYPQIFVSLEYPLFEQMSLFFPIILGVGTILCLYSFIKETEIKVFIPSLNFIWLVMMLYPSILICAYLLVFIFKLITKAKISTVNLSSSQKAKDLFSTYIFWFCFSFVISHILINLFTVNKIYSLARFTFSLPFFFIYLAYILKNNINIRVNNILKWFILVEIIALVEQWVRYGRNLWIG